MLFVYFFRMEKLIQEIPSRVEYFITEVGNSLLLIIDKRK